MGVWNVPSSFKSALQVSVDGVGWSVSQLVSRSVLLKKHGPGNTNKNFFIYTNIQGISNKMHSQKTTELLTY